VAIWNRDFKQASAILRQARILDPHDTLAAWYLATAYWQAGDKENARSVWRDIGIIGDLAWKYIKPAEVALKSNQWETCVESARSALEIAPEEAYAYFLLGKCYQQLGRFDEAIASYSRAGEMAPQGTWFKSSSYAYMGQIYREQLGQPRDALAALQKAVWLEPGDVWSWAAIGHIYLENLQQLPEAEAAYRHAATQLAVGHWGLAQVSLRQGRFADAISEFAQVVVFEPKSAGAHLDLAEAYLLVGLNEKALAEYQIVLQLDPSNQIAQQRVGLLEHNK
jgi:tetratricopeptide (TPR) repeat protein